MQAPEKLASLPPHYLRLLLPYVLADRARAIYFDADTLVLKTLVPLWDMDVSRFALAAIRDYLPCVSDGIDNWAQLGLDPNAAYFNSGVMVVNLAHWRAERVTESVLSVCEQNAQHLQAQGKWPQHEQYGLNVVLHGKWFPLDPIWNHGSHLRPTGEHIVHFAGDGKVGRPACQPEYHLLYRDVLRRTPFFLADSTALTR
jgi:lipopolysaccharide biosynthesis glycosyltransferase